MKNRIYPKAEQKISSIEPETRLEVKSLLLSSIYKAPKSALGDATFACRFQGTDWPGILDALTQPYAKNNLSLTHVRYRIIGKARKHYEADLIATGAPGIVCDVAAEVTRKPLVYEVEEGSSGIEMSVAVEKPFIADICASFVVDESGLVNYLASLCRSVFNDTPEPFFKTGVAICQTASLIEVKGNLLNDGGFAEGGTPGFQIDARVAAPTKPVLDAVLERWTLFCTGNNALRSVFSRAASPESASVKLEVRELGNKTRLPTQFLIAV